MMTYEEAREAARRKLATMQIEDEQSLEYAIAEDETVERDWGWIFFWNTRLYLETRDLEHAVPPRGPLLVNREDGTVLSILHANYDAELRHYERLVTDRPWWRVW